jgi:hypothetical protein
MDAVAQESTTEILPPQVFDFRGSQMSVDTNGDYALRFGFNLGCSGVTMDESANTIIAEDATVTIGGTVYPLVSFGALVALSEETLNRPYVTDVPADKLYSINDDGTVTYTVRVVGIDEDNLKTLIYTKGYVNYMDGDLLKTYVTDVFGRSYQGTYIAANFPKAGDAVHAYLQLGDVIIDLDNGTGTMVVKNITRGWECDQNAYLEFTCYNAADKSLGVVRINIGRIHAGKSSTALSFTMPVGTARMVFKQCVAEFWTDGFH